MKQIIAIGGAGFNHKNPLLDLYIIAQSKAVLPKVMLLPTPAGDNPGLINYFHQMYEHLPCTASELSLFNPDVRDIEDFILSQDIIFVPGGHSKNALILWRDYGIDKMLRKAYNNGVILSGTSAGSVCWFNQCITDSVPGKLSVMPCLGILPYSNCPHFSSEQRQEAYERELEAYTIQNGYANDDCAAIHFVDGKFHRSVALVNDATSYECFIDVDGRYAQRDLGAVDLSNRDNMDTYIFNSTPFKQ